MSTIRKYEPMVTAISTTISTIAVTPLSTPTGKRKFYTIFTKTREKAEAILLAKVLERIKEEKRQTKETTAGSKHDAVEKKNNCSKLFGEIMDFYCN